MNPHRPNPIRNLQTSKTKLINDLASNQNYKVHAYYKVCHYSEVIELRAGYYPTIMMVFAASRYYYEMNAIGME